MIPTRRSLLLGLGAVIASPAIVRASSLMPVKVWKPVLPNIFHIDLVFEHPEGDRPGRVAASWVPFDPTKAEPGTNELVRVGEDGVMQIWTFHNVKLHPEHKSFTARPLEPGMPEAFGSGPKFYMATN